MNVVRLNMEIPRAFSRKLPKILYLIIAALMFFWSAYVFIYGGGGALKRNQLKNEILRLRQDIENLKKEKEILEWKINNIESNPKFIETIAREMGYKKAGEVIFKLIKKEDLVKSGAAYRNNPQFNSK